MATSLPFPGAEREICSKHAVTLGSHAQTWKVRSETSFLLLKVDSVLSNIARNARPGDGPGGLPWCWAPLLVGTCGLGVCACFLVGVSRGLCRCCGVDGGHMCTMCVYMKAAPLSGDPADPGHHRVWPSERQAMVPAAHTLTPLSLLQPSPC